MKRIPCEIYSRVVGYFRPVSNWNAGKREEFRERRPYSVNESLISRALRDGDQIEIGVDGLSSASGAVSNQR